MIAPALEEEGERCFQKVYEIHKKPLRETEPRRRDCFADTGHLRREGSPGRKRRRGASGEGGKSKKRREEAREKERKAGGIRPSGCARNT